MQDQPSTGRRSAATRVQQIRAHTGISRGFLADAPIGRMVLDGIAGITLQVRLTSYRALPLSCVAGIEIAIDGAPLNLAGAALGLGGLFHKLAALPSLSGTSWFVLDFATLFMPRAAPLAPGSYQVTGTLCTVEPYITAGRFAFYNSDARELAAEEIGA